MAKALWAVVFLVLASCGGSSGSANGVPDDGPAAATALSSVVVDSAWLQEHIDDPKLQLVDTRGRTAFVASRIAGAIPIRPESLAATRDGVSAQVAVPADAEPVLRQAGLRNDAVVVVYGEAPAYDPARVVWALSYYGHDSVYFLDGGFEAWRRSGGAVDEAPPTAVPSDYTISAVNPSVRVTGQWVQTELGPSPFAEATIQLVDARAGSEFSAGHIPTARHIEWAENLDSGSFRSMEEIEALHQGMDPAQTTVTYCVTGWRGSFAWLALRHIGYEDVRLYDGSWREWGTGAFPIER